MVEVETKMLPLCGKEAENLNIVLTCGGAANVGLIGYLAAVELTKEGKARMCCITPVGAKIPFYVDIAKRAKKIIVLNGCENQCAKKVVEQAGVKIDHNFIVSEMIKKIPTFDIKDDDIKLVKDKIEKDLGTY
ncbi:zinc-binding protein [Candidatus Bathyarchaeota archaeon]|nr:MAG: zinc-binding protein [Candidatus Bathyarchaeota archaeon]HDM89532.1 zinc-binding protein [Candidatus Bathyarchaeota archaeon]